MKAWTVYHKSETSGRLICYYILYHDIHLLLEISDTRQVVGKALHRCMLRRLKRLLKV